MLQDDVNEIVFQFLIQNHFAFKEATRHLKKKKEDLLASEDPVFHDVIKEQYKNTVKEMLTDAITQQFAIPTESVIIALEGFNVDAYV